LTEHVACIEDKSYIKKGTGEEEFRVSILTFPQGSTFRSHLSGCQLLKVNSASRICLALRIRSLNFEQVSIRDRQTVHCRRADWTVAITFPAQAVISVHQFSSPIDTGYFSA